MSYWTIKQKILFVDINLHLIKIVYHFMEAARLDLEEKKYIGNAI